MLFFNFLELKMGLWGNDPSIFDTRNFKMLDLYVETLQGTTFELRVSSLDTISDVKARIYKHEGIPISQQHLLFNSVELDDDYSLQDYDIQDGNTIKLVPQMRVGPINTRRIHIDEPSLRDYADYFTEANQEELFDQISTSNARPLTVIVYQNGDQINLYRIVDRDSASPLSESLSNASVYGMCEEEEEEANLELTKEKQEETEKLREKMKLLKLRMEADKLEKKPKGMKHLPRPPSSGRASRSRLNKVPTSAGRHILNKNLCLPPVGFTPASTLLSLKPTSEEPTLAAEKNTESEEEDAVAPLSSSQGNIDLSTALAVAQEPVSQPSSARKKLETDSAKMFRLSSVKEDEPVSEDTENAASRLEEIIKKAQVTAKKSTKKWEISQEVLLKDPKPPISPKKETSLSFKEPVVGHKSRSTKGLERLLSEPGEILGQSRPTTTSSKRSTVGAKGGVILESLNPSEVRAMSGMLSNYVRTSSRASRNGFIKDGRIPTPESRIMSARFRLSASRDLGTHRHLPPVKQKKKTVKRCSLCNKKTGLANSYICRCGLNFCAIHRYAESHTCTFDYKTEGRKLLEQSNPVVTAPKLPKI